MVENHSTPIWARPEPAGRRPRHTRAQIAAAALRIADEEGIAALSMRRVAADLGAGTMTLYHYVNSKADLLALMTDAVMAEMLVPEDALTGGWRAGLSAIAHRTRTVLLRHPWAVTGLTGGGMSPAAVRHFEQSLTAVAELALSATEQVEIIELVDNFVSGFVAKVDVEPGADTVLAEDDDAASAYLTGMLSTGEYPRFVAWLGTDDAWAGLRRIFGGLPDTDERFARGLDRLLNGIAAGLSIP